jgi:enoyl-CoA hydratase/carnithine racemase
MRPPIGLVNRVVAPADLEKETEALARYHREQATRDLKLGKLAFQHQLELGVSSAMTMSAK